jgi:hypothetical protein
VNSEMRGQLGDGQDVFGGCHRYVHGDFSRFPFDELYRSMSHGNPLTSL